MNLHLLHHVMLSRAQFQQNEHLMKCPSTTLKKVVTNNVINIISHVLCCFGL